MNTLKLKQMIEELLNKSEHANDLLKELNTHYHFTNELGEPGTYIYFQDTVYNIVVVEDRGKQVRTITNDFKVVINDVIWEISSSLSTKIAMRMPNKNFRKIMFEIRLEILSSIGDNFKEDGEKRISKILKNNPLE